MGPRPGLAVFTRTLLLCVAITWLVHVVTYLLNTQLPLQIVALGGTHGQVGWLFAVNTGIAMVLRPQVGGWVDRYGARELMLAGASVLVITMGALNVAGTPFALIALMAGLGIALALVSTTGSIVVAEQSPAGRRGEALSLYYVASSVGVALGPPAGFALAALGGAALNFAVVTALSLGQVIHLSTLVHRGRFSASGAVPEGLARSRASPRACPRGGRAREPRAGRGRTLAPPRTRMTTGETSP